LSTTSNDAFGKLHACIDTISGGFGHPDMVGYHGQQGQYTDVETLTNPASGTIAAGTFLATEWPPGPHGAISGSV
jgi:hypothetical protein